VCQSCLLNHVGAFQLKTRGDVAVEVSKAANKLSKSSNHWKAGQLMCQIQCGATLRVRF